MSISYKISKPASPLFFIFIFIASSFVAQAQTCSENSSSNPGWITVGTIANAGSTSFDWQNTTTPGQFQAGSNLSPNITSVITPVLQFQDLVAHSTINIAYDLVTANGTSSTINGYTITVIWGSGGVNQSSCSGGMLTATNFATRHNFKISGINLPGNHTPFQVKLTFYIGNSKSVNASNFKTDAALANSGIALYVQVSAFTALRSNSYVNINWTTNYEINNSGFEIQRRYSNQTNFETVGFVNSKAVNGTSTGINNYSYTDVNNSNVVSYYRIRQVNRDGSSKYTEIRQVDGSRVKAKTLVYPNPAINGETNLIFTTPYSKEVQIIDVTGQLVKSWNNYIGQELKIISLKPGIYSVTINNTMTSEKETVRLVVTR
jgi:hypothetical protein